MAIMRTLTLNGVTYAVESSVPTTTTVTLKAADWLGDTSPYSQVLALGDVTSLTKVDLQPTMDQVDALYSQSVAFFTVNEGGVVRVNAVGNKPTEDFVLQVTLTEVEGSNTRIKGNVVGFPNPQTDWLQEDSVMADFLKNKPKSLGGEIPVTTAIDFSGLESGSFVETVDGAEVSHTVTYGEDGRPTAIDDMTITWGDA